MFGTGFHMEPVENVPREVQERAPAISLELAQEEFKNDQSLVDKLQLLSSEYQKELRQIVGIDNLEHYFKFRARLRQQVRDVEGSATPTVEGECAVLEARQRACREAQQFLEEIAFDVGRASKVRRQYEKRVVHAVSEVRARPDEPNYLVLPEMVPKDIHNPWVTYEPPYPGWAWSYSWYRSDEPWTPSFARYLSSASGSLGSYTHTHVSGADDSDTSYVRYRTAMRWWYRLPTAGLVELWMRMQCIDTPYSGWLDDEWGWSGAACDQESYAYLQVISPGPSGSRYATIVDYRRTGTDANWAREVTAPGNYRWAHIFSRDTYPAGTWLLLEVGTQEWNYFWSNDVSIHSAMTQRWFLKRVYVRSTGE